MVILKNKADYSQYKCPYSHLKKEFEHKLVGPEGYEKTYGVWCQCGFQGPVFYLDPDDLRLEKIASEKIDMPGFNGTLEALNDLTS